MSYSPRIILHLCADIGSDSIPYRNAGYDVRCIGKNIGVENYHPPENVYGVIANPVCTMFSICRTNAKTPRDMREGMFLVKECLRIIWECQYSMIAKHIPHKLKFWALENPGSGYLKHYLGNPTYVYQPYEYGENYTKKTALWGYFNTPKKTTPNALAPKHMGVVDRFSPMTHRNREDRMHARSECCPGFAKAFFKANSEKQDRIPDFLEE